jgi:F-type H+-transporting ATPase subunit b
MLEINPGLIAWTIITFGILLIILRLTAWKPLLQALTAREERIRLSIQRAEEAEQEAQRLLEENRRQLAQADAQAQRAIKEGRDLGERLKIEIIEKAHTMSRHMVEQAKEEIRREKDAALQSLRAEVADLAIAAAGKILDESLDPQRHQKLVDAAIRDIHKA